MPSILSSLDRALLLAGIRASGRSTVHAPPGSHLRCVFWKSITHFRAWFAVRCRPPIRSATYEIDLELVNGATVSHREALSRCGVI